MISDFDEVENIVGKGENAGYQHFLLFPNCFQKPSFPGRWKSGLSGKESIYEKNRPMSTAQSAQADMNIHFSIVCLIERIILIHHQVIFIVLYNSS